MARVTHRTVRQRNRAPARRLEYTEGGEVGRRRQRTGTTPDQRLEGQRKHELQKARIGAAGQAVTAYAQRGQRIPGAERIITGDEKEKKPYVRRGARVSRELIRDVRVPGADKYITRAESAEISQRQRAKGVTARRARGRGGRTAYQQEAGGPRIDQKRLHGGRYFGHAGAEGAPSEKVAAEYGRTLETALGLGQAARIRGAERFKSSLEEQRAAVAPYAGPGAAQPTAAPAQPTAQPAAQPTPAAAPAPTPVQPAAAWPAAPPMRQGASVPDWTGAGYAAPPPQPDIYQQTLDAQRVQQQIMQQIPTTPSAQLAPLPSDQYRTWANSQVEQYDQNIRAAQQQLQAQQAQMAQIPQVAAAEAGVRYPVAQPPKIQGAQPPTAPQAPPAPVDVAAMGITGRSLPRPGGEGFGPMTQLPPTPEQQIGGIGVRGAELDLKAKQTEENLGGLTAPEKFGQLPTYTLPTITGAKDMAVSNLAAIKAKLASPTGGQSAQDIAKDISNQTWYSDLPATIANLRRHQSMLPPAADVATTTINPMLPTGAAIGRAADAYQALYDEVQRALAAPAPTAPVRTQPR